MKKILFILIVHCLLLVNIKAQSDTTYTQCISFETFYLFSNGLRIDLDEKINDKSWLQITFEGYANEMSTNTTPWNDEYNYQMAGLGLGLHYRYYLINDSKNFGTYIAPGINGNYFKTNNTEPKSDPEITSTTTIWRGEINLLIGQQYIVADRLHFDVYAGLGFRKSFSTFSNESARKNFDFSDNMFSYGFTGNRIIVGLRVGYLF